MTRDEYETAYANSFETTVRRLMARRWSFDDAWDIAQAAWAKGWERLSQLRGEGCVAAWVMRIATRIACDRIAKAERMPELPLEDDGTSFCEMNLTDWLDLMRVIRKCARRHQVIVHELYFEGHSERELAVRKGRSIAAIRGQAYRARRAIREHFEA